MAITTRATNLLKSVSMAMPAGVYLLVGTIVVLLELFYAINDAIQGGIIADSGFIFSAATILLITFCRDGVHRYSMFYKVISAIAGLMFICVIGLRLAGMFEDGAFSYESMMDGLMFSLGVILIGGFLELRQSSKTCLLKEVVQNLTISNSKIYLLGGVLVPIGTIDALSDTVHSGIFADGRFAFGTALTLLLAVCLNSNNYLSRVNTNSKIFAVAAGALCICVMGVSFAWMFKYGFKFNLGWLMLSLGLAHLGLFLQLKKWQKTEEQYVPREW